VVIGAKNDVSMEVSCYCYTKKKGMKTDTNEHDDVEARRDKGKGKLAYFNNTVVILYFFSLLA
jgi:hypothetical protein